MWVSDSLEAIGKVCHREQTHLDEVFGLKNISNFTNDDVVLSPSKSIKMNMLNHHLNVTRGQRSPRLAQDTAGTVGRAGSETKGKVFSSAVTVLRLASFFLNFDVYGCLRTCMSV